MEVSNGKIMHKWVVFQRAAAGEFSSKLFGWNKQINQPDLRMKLGLTHLCNPTAGPRVPFRFSRPTKNGAPLPDTEIETLQSLPWE